MALNPRSMGKMVLAARGRGLPVDDNLAASARRAIQGKMRGSDQADLDAFLKQNRPAFVSVNSFYKKFSGVADPILNISRDLEMFSQAKASGGNTAIAETRLVKTVTDNLTRLFQKPFMRKAVESAVISMGKDPATARAFGFALRGGLRLAGFAAQAALFAVDAAEGYYSNAREAATAIGKMTDITRNYNLDPNQRRALEGSLRTAFERRETVTDKLFASWFAGEREKYLLQSQEEQAKIIDIGRRNTAAHGVNATQAVEDYARNVGKPVWALTDRQRMEAVNQKLGQQLDYKRFLNNQQVLSRLEKRIGPSWKFFTPSGNRFWEEEREKEAMKYAREVAEKPDRDRLEAVEQARRKMSADELYDERTSVEWAQAEKMAYRSRRVAWSNDF